MSDDEDDIENEDEDLEDEDGDGDGDDDGGYDDDGDGESEHAYSFFEDTEGAIVAGKAFDVGAMLRKDLGTFAAAVDEIAKKHDLKLMVVPSGDLTDTGPGPDDAVYSVVHVGFLADCGGSYAPEVIIRAQVLAALEKAQNVPAGVWAEIGEKLSENEINAYNDAEIGLHLTCVGPLTAATLAYGVLRNRKNDDEDDVDDDDADQDEEESADGCKLHYGQNMEQEPHEQGVWGVRVAYVQYESPESEPLDMSDEAHQKRVELCNDPAAHYYIFARYD